MDSVFEVISSALNFVNNSPLVLLLLGFALTTVLGGILTQRWQAGKKAWELKTSLVSQMTEETINILMAIQFAELGAKSQVQADFDAAYKKWEVRRMVIESTIEAYFPRHDLGTQWNAFSNAVTTFYALTGADSPKGRSEHIKNLATFLGKGGAEWAVLESREWRHSEDTKGYMEYSRAWSDVSK